MCIQSIEKFYTQALAKILHTSISQKKSASRFLMQLFCPVKLRPITSETLNRLLLFLGWCVSPVMATMHVFLLYLQYSPYDIQAKVTLKLSFIVNRMEKPLLKTKFNMEVWQVFRIRFTQSFYTGVDEFLSVVLAPFAFSFLYFLKSKNWIRNVWI